MFVVGLMSGTSADGIDAAVVEWPEGEAARPFRLVAFREDSFDAAFRERIHRLAAGRCDASETLRETTALDALLAKRFADAALRAIADAGLRAEDVAAIASHGQTVGHFPEVGGTLQLGSPSRIAEHSGIETIGNFRVRDMAAGGEGAPLAPFLHWALCSDPAEPRAVLNLGGMANLTGLPAGGAPDGVIAFDVGPANALIDAVVQLSSGGQESFDCDGVRARRGRVDPALLEELLDDEFLRRPPPKSTGRERYGLREAEALLARGARGEPDDLVATLVAFCAEATARAMRTFLPKNPARVFVGGGGGKNPALMEALGVACGVPVTLLDDVGIPADARRGDGVLADGAQRASRAAEPLAAVHRGDPRDGSRRARAGSFALERDPHSVVGALEGECAPSVGHLLAEVGQDDPFRVKVIPLCEQGLVVEVEFEHALKKSAFADKEIRCADARGELAVPTGVTAVDDLGALPVDSQAVGMRLRLVVSAKGRDRSRSEVDLCRTGSPFAETDRVAQGALQVVTHCGGEREHPLFDAHGSDHLEGALSAIFEVRRQ